MQALVVEKRRTKSRKLVGAGAGEVKAHSVRDLAIIHRAQDENCPGLGRWIHLSEPDHHVVGLPLGRTIRP